MRARTAAGLMDCTLMAIQEGEEILVMSTSAVGGVDHHGRHVVAVAVVVDAREGLELAADVVAQVRAVERQRPPAGVDDVEDGATALSGAVVVHHAAGDQRVVVPAVEIDGATASPAWRAGGGRVRSPANR